MGKTFYKPPNLSAGGNPIKFAQPKPFAGWGDTTKVKATVNKQVQDASIAAWKKKWSAAGAALNAAGPALTELYNQRKSGGGGGGGEAPAPPPVTLNYDNKKFEYNIGCVRDAYFSKRQSFHQALVPNAKGALKDSPVKIASSEELWSKAGTNKGMITLFIPTDKSEVLGLDGATPSEGSSYAPKEWAKYGFQFHYNPTSIDMIYSGAPNTDAGLEISGNEKFNLIGAQVSQSTIAFDIVLNRVADMKYYNENGKIKAEVPDRDNLYAPRFPDNTEQQAIFKKGTMYDVEFLLSTVVGYRIDTKYRGRTADVGWLSGRPVTLSLGKGLKYLGFINAFSVKHVIFNERMVPVFSTLSLNFNRIPDYAGI